ncbi:MAG: radical SAM family heme chaperone HemW, partial [Trueperaceae bacterium]
MSADRPRSLYLHVPFCPHVCPYCDFHKMRRDEGLVRAYLDRMETTIAEAGRDWGGALDTIYLGGGTPSHLSDAELGRLFDALDRAFDRSTVHETTIEADPRTFDAARLRTFRAMGIDRLSIGMQSTQDEVLRFLGRAHDAEAGLAAVETGLAERFRVSADVITAVPGQDAELDLERAAATGAGHLSVYTLTIEPFTPFARRRVRVDEDRAYHDYAAAATVLERHGFERYEVSSHARPGQASLHNQAYWHGDAFLGLGPSAAGFLPTDDGLGQRVTQLPIKAWLRGDPPLVERSTAEDHLLERLMTGLRTRRGVDLDALAQRCGIDVRDRFTEVLRSELASGRLILDPATRGVVQAADHLVVVTKAGVDAARAVTYLLAWLGEHGLADKVRRAVVVVNGARSRSG